MWGGKKKVENLKWIFLVRLFFIFFIYHSCIKQMSKILKIEASYIDGSNFIVPCDCSRKF
eukprot:SAG11_NODE_37450_length_256_cov_68.477707_1_plen_59_part_10